MKHQSALDFAERNESMDMVELLCLAGAEDPPPGKNWLTDPHPPVDPKEASKIDRWDLEDPGCGEIY